MVRIHFISRWSASLPFVFGFRCLTMVLGHDAIRVEPFLPCCRGVAKFDEVSNPINGNQRHLLDVYLRTKHPSFLCLEVRIRQMVIFNGR